jgi:hypothetical protein
MVVGFNGDAWGNYGADYGSIVYHTENTLLIDNITNISFEMMVPTELSDKVSSGEMFEVKITVGAVGSTLETTGIMKSDTVTSMYTDVSDVDKIEYIKISFRSLEGGDVSDVKLCISSVSIHSDVYTDGELEDIVLSGELMGGKDNADASQTSVLNVLVVLICLSFIVVAVLWFIFYAVSKKGND